jgi:predicted proteasome-type protease
MTGSEPTLGEVLRRLDEVSRQLQAMAIKLDTDRVENANVYLRKDVYEARHVALSRRMDEVEADAAQKERDAESFRRQIIVGLVLAGVPAVLAMVLAINNFLAAGGATP